MTGRLVVLCPGQGGQSAGMFDMARSDPAANRLLDEWFDDPVLAAPLRAAPDFANGVAQPSIVAATLAMWFALGELPTQPVLVAGYSIGELAAYGVAGALDPPDAIRLAVERARLMDACVNGDAPQAMVALSGATDGLILRYGFHRAIVTAEDALVAGGPAGQRDALAQAAVAAGGRATILPVEIASHTPLLADAVAPFAAVLQRQRWTTPAFPILSGIAAAPVHDATRAIDTLSRQLAETIRWQECMDACAEAGATVALELGPGAALARMLQARHPRIACRSVTEFRTLAGVRSWLHRQLDQHSPYA